MPRARRLRASRLALVVALIAASGCSGYGWVRKSGALGPVRRVAVPLLENHSYEPGVEVTVTDALRREFQRRGSALLVSDPAQADLVISGQVLTLTTSARSFSSVAFALEYQVEMALSLSAKRGDGTPLMLPQDTVREWELYLTSADVEAERKNRDEALRRLASVIASRVHESLSHQLTR